MANINFKQEYLKEQEIRVHYEEAKSQNDTEGMDAARAEHTAHIEAISSMGEHSLRIFQLYADAIERGNEYIDWNDVLWDEHVAAFIQSLRESGIERFTFSSGWSSAVDTAWLFLQNGCTLEGLIEINSPHKDFYTGEYGKAHGYLFAIH